MQIITIKVGNLRIVRLMFSVKIMYSVSGNFNVIHYLIFFAISFANNDNDNFSFNGLIDQNINSFTQLK